MGASYICKCNKCNESHYLNLGVGFSYPMEYEKGVKAMKAGEYGPEYQKFFEEHPDGMTSFSGEAYQCNDCGAYFSDTDLTLYVPKEGFEDEPDPYGIDLEKHYDIYMEPEHKCPSCGGSSKKVKNFEDKLSKGKLKCKCGGKIIGGADIFWD